MSLLKISNEEEARNRVRSSTQEESGRGRIKRDNGYSDTRNLAFPNVNTLAILLLAGSLETRARKVSFRVSFPLPLYETAVPSTLIIIIQMSLS